MLLSILTEKSFSFSRYHEHLYVLFVKELKEYLAWYNLLLTSWINAESEILDGGQYISVLSLYFDLMHFTPRYPDDSNGESYTIPNALKDHGISNV